MSDGSVPAWSLDGEYFENCNCRLPCPCLISDNLPATEDTCDLMFGFHLDRGTYGDVSLDGLNVGMIARAPGLMIEGNWALALYVDERASEAQQQAIGAIFSGRTGGPMGVFAPLIGEVLGIRTAPIEYVMDGQRRSVAIGDVMRGAVHSISSRREVVVAGAHPFNREGVVVAVGEEGSTFMDYGMTWDNSGRSGLYAPIHWSNA